MTFDMVRKATNADDQLARLKYCILEKGYIPKNATDLQPFRHVFDELSVARQVVLRGERLVIPESLQPEVIALAHEGHQGASKMKRYLRSKVWFPNILECVTACLKISTCHVRFPVVAPPQIGSFIYQKTRI